MTSSSVEEVLGERFAEWHLPPDLEREVFGTERPVEIAELVRAFTEEHLGAPITSTRFYRSMQACVLGVELGDGRKVVLKVHPARTGREFIETVVAIQGRLGEWGFPCPAVVAGPIPLAEGFCVAEALVEGGPRTGTALRSVEPWLASWPASMGSWPTCPRCRRCRLRMCCARPRGISGLHPITLSSTSTAPPRGRNGSTTLRWRPVSDSSVGRYVVSHGDWSAKEMRMAGSTVVAVHDWQSLCGDRETVVLGLATGHFTMTWDIPVRVAPSPPEMLEFVHAFESERGKELTAEERSATEAALVLGLAYTARCEHAVDAPWEGHAREWLAAHGEAVLRDGLR